jgi:hypothetical protein
MDLLNKLGIWEICCALCLFYILLVRYH